MSSDHPFAQYYNNDEWSDLTVLCDGKRFHAHRIVLATVSKEFANQLRQSPDKPVLAIEDVTVDAVREMMSYIYRKTFKLENNWQTVVGLIKLSHRYAINGLYTYSVKNFVNMAKKPDFLTADNFMAIKDTMSQYLCF